MTRRDAMSNELEAGPELDAAVARAIGVPSHWFHDNAVMCGCFDRDHFFRPRNERHSLNGIEVQWSPSTDLNAAFEAAEKCGLFVYDPNDESEPFLWFDRTRNAWCVSKYESGTHLIESWPSGAGTTPAVAICRAILKLKGEV
jgi:hypothetical protein